MPASLPFLALLLSKVQAETDEERMPGRLARDGLSRRRLCEGGRGVAFRVVALPDVDAWKLFSGTAFLILARIAQGLGAAIMVPASLAILSHAFPDPEERGHAVSAWANTASVGFAAGPVLGGILTAWIGWRSIFWLNIPVGIVAICLNHIWIEEARVETPRRIDWPGQTALGFALLALTYGLIEAGRQGWTSGFAFGRIRNLHPFDPSFHLARTPEQPSSFAGFSVL
jgi:MFS family permease